MSHLIRRVIKKRTTQIPEFKSGDTVNVYVRVKEGEKERVQVYKGVVIKVQGSGTNRSFTVRKMSSGVGVERTFPFMSPAVDKVELVSIGKVRRARLFYLRDLKGRAATINSELVNTAAASKNETPEVATEN